jgi:circadian clock protein KaiB
MSAKKLSKTAARPASKRPVTHAPKVNGAARRAAPASKPVPWNLRLYVAGDSPRSRMALANLRKLCESRLDVRYDIEVIDLTKRPDLAKADQILALPTLIRKIPEPMKRIIGDLSDADRALVALEMQDSIQGVGR